MREERLNCVKRTRERKTLARPVLDRLEKWMKENQCKYRPNSPMGKAIDYSLPRRAGLTAYVHHGQMGIVKNLIENAVSPLAILRKNFLFCRSYQQAAQQAAGIYSFIANRKKSSLTNLNG